MGLPGKATGSVLGLGPSLVFIAAMTLSLLAWHHAWRGEDSHAHGLFLAESESVRLGLIDAISQREALLQAARRVASVVPQEGVQPWQRLGGGFEAIRFIGAVGGAPPDTVPPVWRPAAEQARDQDRPILSAVFAAGEAALFLPGYAGPDPGTVEGRRDLVTGWFLLPLDLPGLLTAVRIGMPLPLALGLDDDGNRILASATAAAPLHTPAYSDQRPVAVGGRQWQVFSASEAAFEDATRTGQPTLVLVLGVGMTLALWVTVTVLQSNQRRFQDIAESASNWFWETNANFEFTYLSDRFFEITGLDPDQILGRTQWDMAGPRQIAAARTLWQSHFRAMTARESFRALEMTLVDRNGAVRHILLSGKPSRYDNGVFRGYRGIGSDITQRKLAEAEAAKSAAQLRAAIEAMPNGLIMFGEDLRLILYNRRFLELVGLTEEDVETRRYLPHIIRFLAEQGRYGPGDVGQLVAERLARIVQPISQSYELRLGDGRILEIRSYGRSEAGYLLSYLDITDRRRAEDALRQSAERLRLALTATHAGVWDLDLVAGTRWCSPEVAEMLGYPPAEANIAEMFEALIHPADWPAVHQRAKRHLAGETTEFRAQYRLKRPSGDWTWVEDSGQAIRDAAGCPIRFIGTVVDSSERRITEGELIRAEKMAALGRLVAGVAHEINTPVGLGVSVASYLDQRTLKLHQLYQAGDVTQEDFEEFVAAARESCASLLANLRRAAALVRSFKLVAVDQSCEHSRAFNVRTYIDEVLISLGPKLKKTRHTLTVTCPADLVLTTDPGALSQILTNLIDNSLVHGFDGIHDGCIRIEVRDESAGPTIFYADDGRGMSPDHLEKIFEPFFTTRRGQGGSGLGMHVVYNLVTQTLGGSVLCDSAPDQGFSLTIRLPPQTRTANQDSRQDTNQELRHDGSA